MLAVSDGDLLALCSAVLGAPELAEAPQAEAAVSHPLPAPIRTPFPPQSPPCTLVRGDGDSSDAERDAQVRDPDSL